jgi:broad specificity phosphatase PhoE
VASPFARTLETATLAGEAVGIAPGDARFATAEELVERHFGDFELQDHAHYKTVWEEDARDLAWCPPGGGESVRDVAARAAALFSRLEAELGRPNPHPKRVLIVAHGDTLSIATAVAKGADLGRHRDHAQETGQLVRLSV